MQTAKCWILFCCGTFLLFSCGESIEKSGGFIASEIAHLLSNSSAKVWVKTETRIDGQASADPCDDSLVYVFARITGLSVKGNQFFMGFTSCTEDEFCARYPAICDTQSSFCEDNETFCNENPGLIFAGTWAVVAPEEKSDKTNEFIINFPGDTTRYLINHITSENLEVTHVESTSGGEVQVFEKFIR